MLKLFALQSCNEILKEDATVMWDNAELENIGLEVDWNGELAELETSPSPPPGLATPRTDAVEADEPMQETGRG